jgi:uncharacterized membrane protein
MEPFFGILIFIGLIILIFVLPIVAFAKAGSAQHETEDLKARLLDLTNRLRELQDRLRLVENRSHDPSTLPQAADPVSPDMSATPVERALVPSPLPPVPEPEAAPIAGTPAFAPKSVAAKSAPPPLPPSVAASAPVPQAPKRETIQEPPVPVQTIPRPPATPPKKQLTLEQFMGQKLFAWLGGLALFFGIMFFVKHYFENHSLPPAVRVTIGFIIGTGLTVAGIVVHRRKAYTVLGQTFCASGVLILYGVTFASHALYHLLGTGPTFALIVLITVVAFLIAVQLEALVVAILGMVGGFLTPILCSTREDNPMGLFSYIALLDIGLLMVARKRRWFFLTSMGAAGTALMQFGWFVQFFNSGHYSEGALTLVPMGVFLGFAALFTLAAWRARGESEDLHPFGSALGLGMLAMLFGFIFVGYGDIATRPWLLYGYMLLLNLAFLAAAWFDRRLTSASWLCGLLTFGHLALWTMSRLTPDLLGAALVLYLIFGALHVVFLVIQEKLRPEFAVGNEVVHVMPAIVMGLLLIPLLHLSQVPFVMVYGAVLVFNAIVLVCAWRVERAAALQWICGLATFFHLSVWTMRHLTDETMMLTLGAFLVFGAMHTVFSVARSKTQSPPPSEFNIGPWFPIITLTLIMLPLLTRPEVSMLIWPAVLLADLLAIIVAGVTASLLPVLFALGLTLFATMVWLFKLPATDDVLTGFLFILGLFAGVFAIASCWLARKQFREAVDGNPSALAPDSIAGALPIISGALPFLLLIMVTMRLPVANPSPVFGLALLLVLLLLGLAKIARLPALSIASLGCVLALEGTWHLYRFNPESAWIPLLWSLGFYVLFALYPFLFRQTFRNSALPWASAALSSVGHGALVFFAVKHGFPSMSDKMGLIPALFAVPSLVSLVAVIKWVQPDSQEVRNSLLAWFGGVALFFITLIFPIQFDRQWITLGWAFEGAALIWLFHRVPHQGLVKTGLFLLGAAFVRLALNPAVLDYHPRSGTLLNWHLYTYGLAAVAMFMGAKWLKKQNARFENINFRAVLYSFGGILLFLLLNIEIADYFTPEGSRSILFKFSGSLARDMTYSIAWALFALGLIVIGLVRNAKGARYAGVGLMAFTLAKLFLHDLATIDSVYRVGALIAVAIIALAASFLYQRFSDRTNES